MNKPEIVERLARETGLTARQVTSVLNALFSTREGRGLILEAVEAGEEFRIAGFGSFLMREREPRPGKNPKTGETIEIPERRYLLFRPGAGVRERFSHPGAVERRAAPRSEAALPMPAARGPRAPQPGI